MQNYAKIEQVHGDYSDIRRTFESKAKNKKIEYLKEVCGKYSKLFNELGADRFHKMRQFGRTYYNELFDGDYHYNHDMFEQFENDFNELSKLVIIINEENIKPKINFNFSFEVPEKMREDFIKLSNDKLIKLKDNKPNFPNLQMAIIYFDAAHNAYDIPGYGESGKKGGNKNVIIANSIYVNSKIEKDSAVKKARSRITDDNKYKNQIFESLPHLNK